MNRDPQQQARYEALLKNSKKMKKRILLAMAGLLGVILLLVAGIQVAQWITESRVDDGKAPDLDIIFYDPYEGDIMENEEYLGLNRWVFYCSDPYGYGSTTAISEDNRDTFNPQVLFLYDYIQTIIAGDHEAYNACFNDTYYKRAEPKEPFSQQMLHNIKIYYYEREAADLITYRLDYMIHRNDGTFRRDVASDASRYQLITLRISPNGEISIERLVTPH